MSLKHLDSQIEDLGTQAASIQKRGARTRDIVNSDRTLSDVGKREKLDEAAAQTKASLSDLRARHNELVTKKRESLERELFGLKGTASDPNQLIAYRDAQDRAAKLPDSAAATALLASANQSGDRTLAAAVVARALREVGPAGVMGSNGWRNVVNTYAERDPSDGDKLKDLLNLPSREAARALFVYMSPF